MFTTARPVVRLIASRVGALAALLASGFGNDTGMRTGPSARGPAPARQPPPAPDLVGGRELSCMLLPSTMPNAGAAARAEAVADNADTHGRRITVPTQRVQNRDWVDSGRRDQFSADRRAAARPNSDSSAGIRVAEVSTANATARIAPVAIDRSTGVPIR